MFCLGKNRVLGEAFPVPAPVPLFGATGSGVRTFLNAAHEPEDGPRGRAGGRGWGQISGQLDEGRRASWVPGRVRVRSGSDGSRRGATGDVQVNWGLTGTLGCEAKKRASGTSASLSTSDTLSDKPHGFWRLLTVDGPSA